MLGLRDFSLAKSLSISTTGGRKKETLMFSLPLASLSLTGLILATFLVVTNYLT
jgi:hypothetical protein